MALARFNILGGFHIKQLDFCRRLNLCFFLEDGRFVVRACGPHCPLGSFDISFDTCGDAHERRGQNILGSNTFDSASTTGKSPHALNIGRIEIQRRGVNLSADLG